MRMRFRAKFEQVSQRPPIISTKDPSTGELRGVAVDLSRELAARIGVELVQVSHIRDPNAWDMAFLGIDPARCGAKTRRH